MYVDVLYGGPGHERAISIQSGQAFAAALRERGFDVMEVMVDQQCDCSALRAQAVVANLIHGQYGEDGQLQQVLQEAGKSFIGSDAQASALCMDKGRMRAKAQEHGVPVAWGMVLDPRNPAAARDCVPPTMTGLVIKPCADGSSVGMRLLPSKSFLLPALEELLAELGPVPFLVEERLPGPEYSVPLLERDGKIHPLPPICIIPAQGVYDFAAKYERNDTQYTKLDDPALYALLQERAVTCFRSAGCRHLARVDFMAAADGDPKMLEVNTLPGFTSHSLVPMAAQWEGMSFAQLCEHVVGLAAPVA